MAIGQTKPLLITKIITLGINGLGLAISLRYGIVAVTAAYVASWYIVVPIYYYYVNRYINLKGYIRNIGSAFVGSLIMGAVISFTRYMLQNLVSTAILVAILFIISLVSYILTLLVISPKSVTQFIFMIKLLLNKSPNSQVEINYFSLNDVADE
jgi:O-antigen/teichoic acid export membrane protein